MSEETPVAGFERRVVPDGPAIVTLKNGRTGELVASRDNETVVWSAKDGFTVWTLSEVRRIDQPTAEVEVELPPAFATPKPDASAQLLAAARLIATAPTISDNDLASLEAKLVTVTVRAGDLLALRVAIKRHDRNAADAARNEEPLTLTQRAPGWEARMRSAQALSLAQASLRDYLAAITAAQLAALRGDTLEAHRQITAGAKFGMQTADALSTALTVLSESN